PACRSPIRRASSVSTPIRSAATTCKGTSSTRWKRQQRSVVPGRRLLAVQLEDSEDLCRHVSGDGYVLLTRDHRDDYLGEPRLEVICLHDKRRAKLGGT